MKTYIFDDKGRRRIRRPGEESGGGRRKDRRGHLYVPKTKDKFLAALKPLKLTPEVTNILADISVEFNDLAEDLAQENDRLRYALGRIRGMGLGDSVEVAATIAREVMKELSK